MEAHRAAGSRNQASTGFQGECVRLGDGLHIGVLLYVRDRRAGVAGMVDRLRAARRRGARWIFHLLEFVAARMGDAVWGCRRNSIGSQGRDWSSRGRLDLRGERFISVSLTWGLINVNLSSTQIKEGRKFSALRVIESGCKQLRS